ncbi:MAG: ABC transporter ATP-binding protein [Oscillospiraceae bacterium]
MKDFLTIENIAAKYQAENGEILALDNINFSVKEGEIISIVGPSGCGKSTLLSIIAGLLKPSSGRVLINNEEIEGISPSIGYMLQRDNLLEWRTIYKNILLGLEIQKKLTQDNIAYAKSLMKTYGLIDFADKYPSQLSGGMRQRVALIRTLVLKPKVLLLDEAFAALDYQTRLAVTDDVYRILKSENKTTLIVTHDIPESISMADRVIVLSRRPASVKKIYNIEFEGIDRTPLNVREQSKYGEYFNLIWKELDVYV